MNECELGLIKHIGLDMNNCYTWAKKQIDSNGGNWVLAWSVKWFGHFHVLYVDKDGTMWGYDPDDTSYISLKRFFATKEWTFEGHAKVHKTYVPFMTGLKDWIF